MIKSTLFTAGMMLACLFMWWCSGYNFDTRGEQALFCAETTIMSGLVGYLLSRLEDY